MYYKIQGYRAVLKDVRSQGGEGFFQCGHFSEKGEGGFQMRMSALFGAKSSGFFEICECTDKEGG